MFQVHVLMPDHLNPQTAADREAMAGSMADWVRDQGDGPVIVAAKKGRQHITIRSVTFRGLSSVAVPRTKHDKPAPENATKFERVVLAKRRYEWRASYLVETAGDRLETPRPMDEGEAVRRGGKLD